MIDSNRDCKHGQLARSCEICELRKENAELRTRLEPCSDGELHQLCQCVERLVIKLEAVARAAEKARKWMEPVMDGFDLPKDCAARRTVLIPLKEALAALGDKNDKS